MTEVGHESRLLYCIGNKRDLAVKIDEATQRQLKKQIGK